MTLRSDSYALRAVRLAGALTLAAALSACATIDPPPELGDARLAYEEATADPLINKYASVPLYEAKKELDRAAKIWEETGDAEESAHVARLAEKRVAIAEKVAMGAQAQAETRKLLGSRSAIELQTREAQIAARDQAIAAREREIAELKAKPTDSGMVLTLGGDVLFDTGKATIAPGARAQLDRVAQFLREHPGREVVVTGHTDSTGTASFNQTLSEQRAAAVGSYLTAAGIDGRRVATRGRGLSMPVASNATSAGRQQNRRVDILVLDAGQKASEHVLSR